MTETQGVHVPGCNDRCQGDEHWLEDQMSDKTDPREHVTDVGAECWCEPVVITVQPPQRCPRCGERRDVGVCRDGLRHAGGRS